MHVPICWGEQPMVPSPATPSLFTAHGHFSAYLTCLPVLPCPCAVLCALTKAAALTRMHPIPGLLPIFSPVLLTALLCCCLNASTCRWHLHLSGCKLLQWHGCCSSRLGHLPPAPACPQQAHSVPQHPLLFQIRPPSPISTLVMPAATSAPSPFLIP